MAKALVEKKTISAQVADAIRSRILAGDYQAGEQLRQEHIASEFGVSRIPVREALHQLHSEGFVRLVSHRGAVVSEVSLGEIQELYELRARVETWLLALAIPNMTEADLEKARACADLFGSEGDQSDQSQALNWDFHAALYAPSNRKTTIELIGRIHQQIERYTRMMVTLTSSRAKSHREHLALLECCRTRDTLRAVNLLDMHIMESGQFLIERLKELRDAKPATARNG